MSDFLSKSGTKAVAMKFLFSLAVLMVLAQVNSSAFADDRDTVYRSNRYEDGTAMSLSDSSGSVQQSSVAYQSNGQLRDIVVPVGYDYNSSIAPTACGQCDDVCAVECTPWWAHKSSAYGELLYLRPGDANIVYAVQQTGIVANSSPTGPLGFTAVHEHLGYKVGLTQALTQKSSLYASFASWHGDNLSNITATGTDVLNSTMIHPSTATVGAASLAAEGRQRLGFNVVDAGLRHLYRASDCGVLNWNLGLRYGNLKQGMTSSQTVSVPNGLTTVDANVKFHGFGIAGGLDGERRSVHTGLLAYGRVMGSLLAGNWKSDYRQSNQFNPGVIGNNFEEFRVSPVIDTELGFGWRTADDGFRVTAGYLFSSWLHAINNRDYIQAVRDSRLFGLDNSMTFSGLTFRTELRF
jgi:Legionella pneumophila major outer membrane protein precursor